jgi:hypothetical protein
MPPSSPPTVFVPPSPASPPAAPGAVFQPAPVGKAVLTISGVSTSGINGNVYYAGLQNGVYSWTSDGLPVTGNSGVVVDYNGSYWRVAKNYTGSTYTASKTSGAATPDGLTSWTVGLGTGSPVIAAAAAPTPPAIFTP